MKDDNSKLIPELADWNAGAGITVEAWISGVGRFDHALGYATIFWPTFVQYERCIFRYIPDQATYQEWMRVASGDCAKVEAMVNHLHLVDLFTGSDYQPSKALLVRLGQIMEEMWFCKLAQDFPDKRFETRFTSDVENLTDLELTFYQLYLNGSTKLT
jgi:hypothetical protein